jgi:hypothetical protein
VEVLAKERCPVKASTLVERVSAVARAKEETVTMVVV